LSTLKDISKIANVNVSTVSKALRGSSDINQQTILRIQKIAEQLNYKRTAYNTPVSGDTLPLIGIICPEVNSMYYADILNSLQLRLFEAGFQSIVMISNFDRTRETFCIDSLMRLRVNGIVFFTENDVDADDLKNISYGNGMSFVVVSGGNNNDFCDNICIDELQSVSIAVTHLINLKHTNIAYIGDSLSFKRRGYYIQTMESYSIPINNDYIIESDIRFEQCGYNGMIRLLQLKEPPTAIFAAYDNIAIGAMRAIYENGFSIPGDFSVIGIDNLRTSSFLNKALTSVTEPTADLGELTGELIINRIRKNPAVQHIKLIPTLNTRETTAVLDIR